MIGSGGRRDGRPPRGAGHGAAQDVYDVAAALAGGVDAAADVQPVLGGVLAGEPADIFCWVLTGRTPRSLTSLVGQTWVSWQKPQDVALAVAAEFQQVPAGVLGGGVLRPGDTGDAGQPSQDGVAELVDQRAGDVRGHRGPPGVTGGMPGADQAAQRPLGLHRPDRGRVALGRVLEVRD